MRRDRRGDRRGHARAGRAAAGRDRARRALGVAPMTLRQALAVLARRRASSRSGAGDGGGASCRRGRAAGARPGPPPSSCATLTDWRRAGLGRGGRARRRAPDRRRARTAPRGARGRRRRPCGEATAFRRADARFHVAIAELGRSRPPGGGRGAAAGRARRGAGDHAGTGAGPARVAGGSRTDRRGDRGRRLRTPPAKRRSATSRRRTTGSAGSRGGCGVGAADPAPPTTGALTHSRLRLLGSGAAGQG